MPRSGMEMDLSGRPAIVTGGAMGIGEGVVECLAKAGAPVFLTDRYGGAAENTAARLRREGLEVMAFQADVTQEEDVAAMTQACLNEFGSVRTVVANAGIYQREFMEAESSLDTLRHTLDVNVIGAYATAKYGLEAMLAVPVKVGEETGNIIVISSVDAARPLGTGLTAYDASKAGVEGVMRNASAELGQRHRVRVNAIRPGGVITPGIQASAQQRQSDPQRTIRDFIEQVPLGRMGTPEDIGKAAVFLAWHTFINGETIAVDGGWQHHNKFPGE